MLISGKPYRINTEDIRQLVRSFKPILEIRVTRDGWVIKGPKDILSNRKMLTAALEHDKLVEKAQRLAHRVVSPSLLSLYDNKIVFELQSVAERIKTLYNLLAKCLNRCKEKKVLVRKKYLQGAVPVREALVVASSPEFVQIALQVLSS
jgi:hypothetical protein